MNSVVDLIHSEPDARLPAGADGVGAFAEPSGSEKGSVRQLDNAAVAHCLEQVAELLEARNANPFRVRSYRRAAELVRNLSEPLTGLIDRAGIAGLDALPGIGPSLARSIEQLARTGHLAALDRLRAETAPGAALRTVAGIGPETAERIHEQLGISTLGELQAAAIDGRLANVPGIGRKRVRSVIECLTGRMRRVGSPPRREPQLPAQESAKVAREPAQPAHVPPVAELLDVDHEYREKAAAGRLPMIAPRRFNPTGEAWLPILHTERGSRHYTALYSNTARAHELGTTHDWVVIYLDNASERYQCTVITSRFGPLSGKRIVRGRESECREYYEHLRRQLQLALGDS